MKNIINKIIRRIAVFFAVFFAAGLFNISANAQEAVRCPDGQYDATAGLAGNGNCMNILTPTGTTNEGEDIPGVTVVLIGLFSSERLLIIINNRTDGGGDVDYKSGFHANAILVPIDADFPTLALSDSGNTNVDPVAIGMQDDYFIGTGSIPGYVDGDDVGARYHSLPQTLGIAFCTGGQVHAPGDTTMCVNPLNCTGTATMNGAGTACVCNNAALPILQDDGGNSFSCRAREGRDCTGATPDLVNGICVVACQSDETRNSAGVCEPNAITCSGNTPDLFNGMCVVACQSDETRNSAGVCETNTQTNTGGNPLATPQQAKKDNSARLAGGIVVLGLMAALFYTHSGDYFTFSPDYGYSLTESGYSANAGGRADFRKDNWHLYYTAKQTNANGQFGDFRYKSGGKYTADIWTATFSESVQGETADYDFSLSADMTGSFVSFQPVYRLHSEYEKGETETQNTLNLEGVLRYNGWQIRPSAGFRWENADNFGDNARFRINAVHRF